MRRASFLILALAWFFAVGHCLAESSHTHPAGESSSSGHHHHHGDAKDHSKSNSPHADPCELQNLQLKSCEKLLVKALPHEQSLNLFWMSFLLSDSPQLSEREVVSLYEANRAPIQSSLQVLFTHSLRSAANAPPCTL